MLDKLDALSPRLRKLTDRISFVGPTLARLTLGVLFVGTGWGKLHGLPNLTRFFTELGIPAPGFQALLVATTEFVGGALLLVGLLTRLAALPLAVTMVVAILTAKRSEIDGVSSLFGFEEWSYLVMFVWLAAAGPGPWSLDRLIGRFIERRSPAAR